MKKIVITLFTILVLVLIVNSTSVSGSGKTSGLEIKDNVLIKYTGKATQVIIPDNVTQIGKKAFATSKITSVTIPDTVTSIGEDAFDRCFYLKNIELPSGLVVIGEEAFSGCRRLTSLTLPEGVKEIGDRAFAECYKLVSASVPETVETIGKNIFGRDVALTNLTVASGNPYFASDGKLLYNKEKTVLICYPSSEGDITIPEGVEEIGEEVFYKCYASKVTFPHTLKTIKDNVFSDCGNLEEIYLPESLQIFGTQPFYNCAKLTGIHVFDTEGSMNFVSENGALYNTDKTILFCNPASGDILVPETVTEIKSYAFPNVRVSVTIPENTVILGENIFVNEEEEETPANKTPLCIYGYMGSTIENYCIQTNWGVRFLAFDKTYTITYHLNGGKKNASNPETFSWDTKTIILGKPTRKGYVFKYWYEDISRCEDGCCRGQKVRRQIKQGSLGDLVLYARWEKE